jgi:glutathione S-transferase
MERIPTTSGVVRCSKAHGADERAENIAIARHFAEKYGHEIDLLPRSNRSKCADAYNRTLGMEQEYKTNRTPTVRAIDKELQRASRQAGNIVLHVLSDISDDLLKQGIKGRVAYTERIEAVTILRRGEDKTYTRAQVLSHNFNL